MWPASGSCERCCFCGDFAVVCYFCWSEEVADYYEAVAAEGVEVGGCHGICVREYNRK